MENTNKSLTEIIQMWKELSHDVQNNKFHFDLFKSAFSKTYALLTKQATAVSLDKQYVQLICEAYLFANVNSSVLESTCFAACVLTERMLDSLAFSNASDDSGISTAYILEAREEITLDFNDISASISKLARIYSEVSTFPFC